MTVGQTPGREVSFPTAVQWNKQRGVTTYRLQIAGDETFRDIFLDRRINRERHVVTGIPPGYYYWRVAAADSWPANFSRPARFFISGGVVTNVKVGKRSAGSPMLWATASPRVR